MKKAAFILALAMLLGVARRLRSERRRSIRAIRLHDLRAGLRPV